MSAIGYAGQPSRVATNTLFGRVMGLVALTVAVRDARRLRRARLGRRGLVHRLAAVVRLPDRPQRRQRPRQHRPRARAAVRLRPARGASVSTTVNYYAETDPTAVRQAFGATALFVGVLGAGGYATRRDLSFLYRIAFWLLLGLLVAGIVLIFVRIPAAYTLYSIFGLGVFGLYIVIDFNRLRRAGSDEAIPLAAGIFLDVLNIFLFFLRIFGRSR